MRWASRPGLTPSSGPLIHPGGGADPGGPWRTKLNGPEAAAAANRNTTTTSPASVDAAAASRARRAVESRRAGTARANSGVATPRKATDARGDAVAASSRGARGSLDARRRGGPRRGAAGAHAGEAGLAEQVADA